MGRLICSARYLASIVPFACRAACVRKYRSARALKLVVRSRAGGVRIFCCRLFAGIRTSFGIASPHLRTIIYNRRAVLLNILVLHRAPQGQPNVNGRRIEPRSVGLKPWDRTSSGAEGEKKRPLAPGHHALSERRGAQSGSRQGRRCHDGTRGWGHLANTGVTRWGPNNLPCLIGQARGDDQVPCSRPAPRRQYRESRPCGGRTSPRRCRGFWATASNADIRSWKLRSHRGGNVPKLASLAWKMVLSLV
jgi:hypothetical protein